MGKAESKYRYNHLTWPRMNEAISQKKLVDELRECAIESRACMYQEHVQNDIRW